MRGGEVGRAWTPMGYVGEEKEIGWRWDGERQGMMQRAAEGEVGSGRG